MATVQQRLDAAAQLHRSGQLTEAEKLYAVILAQDKRNIPALCLLGTLYIQTGRADQAIVYLQKAYKIDPRNAEIVNNLAAAYHQSGKLVEAIKLYQLATRLKPNYPEALNNLGAVLLQAGRVEESISPLQAALKLVPGYAQACDNLAKAYLRLGRGDEAIAQFKRSLQINPANTDALFHLGGLLRDAARFDEAIEYYHAMLSVVPNDHRLQNNLGNLYRESGKLQQALPFYQAALEHDPHYIDALINCGVTLQDMGDLDGARGYYEQALRRTPHSADAHLNYGSWHMRRNELEQAAEHYGQSMALQPDSINARWNLGMVKLAQGDYATGWAYYECGFGALDKRGTPPFGEAKKWRGEDLHGKRLLIWGEQGLGDQLQFVRYAMLCKERGAEVSALVSTPLLAILATCPALHRVVDKATPEDFDYHCAMMSLPHMFGTLVENIPAPIPYLFVPQACQDKWRDKVLPSGSIKVGLVWAGNARENLPQANLIDQRRSMSLEQLVPLLDVDGVDFYNLQMGKPAAQLDAPINGFLPRSRIRDLMPEVKDFTDTAAIIEQLDLVITVDTSVAHLTGALGKPVWILSRHDPCWRWLNNRVDSPWYPTARIFGQKEMGSWDGVLSDVRQALVLKANAS